MQFTLTINQAKALEWGLNAQQALLFSFVYSCPSWTRPVTTEGGIFFALSKAKILEELPLLTDKPDTAYRLLKALEVAGLIELSSTSNITLFRLTERGQEWNRKLDGSEKYPTSKPLKGRKKIRSTSDKSPSRHGKKSEPRSEKYPTNQDTSNQDTHQGTSQYLQTAPAAPLQPVESHSAVDVPRVQIPDDMPGPRDRSCKTFKAWANYAMAYRKRYSAWPVWNAKVAGQVGQLVDRLGFLVAHHVAAYYVSVNDSRLINGCHTFGDLLARAEAFHTQWATNRQMNGTTAQQIERKQANLSAGQEAARRIIERAGGQANEFF
ncbi:phage replication protein [Pseudomonas alliivorans]|uniref:phage replication protein n=1 Tax=Pseudomonas alliivorans TaxID=2810613 RepID=UPI001AE86153|nr:phage replication protein [Pseudomonas alliivorans]MBP0943111.1 phage replication protein [Pseudomonas alliivorans]MEE4881207.1 phage replication protein [Pseudomonas alliivorans]MEE4932511.1 phage replication protein [Pseudomonas alliivorans]MEE4937974.1 phage replication protein [Pseudomonas alliivorans]MEE4943093.1 phage replication protein [Pseudomonas alliivorans]